MESIVSTNWSRVKTRHYCQSTGSVSCLAPAPICCCPKACGRMTTAHRPTWHAAVGQKNEGGWQAGGACCRSASVASSVCVSLVLTVSLDGAKTQANSRTSSLRVICLATPSSRPGASLSMAVECSVCEADDVAGCTAAAKSAREQRMRSSSAICERNWKARRLSTSWRRA